MLTIEGPKSFHLSSGAHLIEENREVAWAENHIVRDPDLRFVLGNYVEADNANDNGHIFPLADLKVAQASIARKPLNMLHSAHSIVGAFLASEMMYPELAAGEDLPTELVKCGNCGTVYDPKFHEKCPSCQHTETVDTDPFLHPGDGGDATKAAAYTANPKVEALAVFWKYYFPDVYSEVERAHSQGSLYFSMECVPNTVGCIEPDCKGEYAYMGRSDPSYCEHLNAPGARKLLNKPHFTAGALIVPPVRPGWKRADVKEISQLVKASLESETVYEQVSKEFAQLSPEAWESIMALTIAKAERV